MRSSPTGDRQFDEALKLFDETLVDLLNRVEVTREALRKLELERDYGPPRELTADSQS